MATVPNVSVRLPQAQADWLTEWGQLAADPRKPAALLPEAVAMLELLLDAELRRIPLSVQEAALLAQARGSALLDVGMGVGVGSGLMAADLIDMLAPETGVSLIDVPASYERDAGLPPGAATELVARLRTLGPAADLALRMALARWWLRQLPADAEGFAAAGLRIIG